MKKKNPYIRLAIVLIDEVLPCIEDLDSKKIKEYYGVKIRMDSMRYRTFLNSGIICKSCVGFVTQKKSIIPNQLKIVVDKCSYHG